MKPVLVCDGHLTPENVIAILRTHIRWNSLNNALWNVSIFVFNAYVTGPRKTTLMAGVSNFL